MIYGTDYEPELDKLFEKYQIMKETKEIPAEPLFQEEYQCPLDVIACWRQATMEFEVHEIKALRELRRCCRNSKCSASLLCTHAEYRVGPRWSSGEEGEEVDLHQVEEVDIKKDMQ